MHFNKRFVPFGIGDEWRSRNQASILGAVVLACLLLAGPAQAVDVSGDQAGTWTLANSPYNLVGNVRVPPGLSLTIEPGVEVIGMGNYKISVASSAFFHALGTVDQPILFTASDHNVGWRGLRFEASHDQCEVDYCIFEYAKGTGDFPEVRGGAIMVINCSPTITNSIFRYNSSANVNQNGTGGGICTESSDAVIEYNLFHDNVADSGGAVCTTEYGSPRVAHNTVLNNRANYAGGGMYFGARSSPLIEYNLIMGNSSSGWGGGGINCWTSFIFYGTYATVRNNIITHNTSTTTGGGMYCRYDRTVMYCNLIAYNSAPNGSGIHVLNQGSSAPIVGNSIVYFNDAPGGQITLENTTGSQVNVDYSNVEGGWIGGGNISADPLLNDPDGADNIPGTIDDDYHIIGNSPCIDAGNNFSIPPDLTVDFDGAPRFVDDAGTPDTGFGVPPLVDMGPFEFQGTSLGIGAPIPGNAGQTNEIRILGGSTGQYMFLAYGLNDGSTPVPGCGPLHVSISNPKVLGKKRADALGKAAFRFFVPNKARGVTVLFQAVDPSSCRASLRIDHEFR